MAHTYRVVGAKQETVSVVTLRLAFLDGSLPSYIPGQYLTVYSTDASRTGGKAYSISSGPSESTLSITVRAVGEFSNRLCALQSGDTMLASLPQGAFYPERPGSALVLVAGGIGITPFRSIIFDAVRRPTGPGLYLFYSVPVFEEALFEEEFHTLSRRYGKLHIKKYVTRESPDLPLALARRITPQEILRTVSDAAHSEFLISGTTSFVREQRRGLINTGIQKEHIYIEAYA